MRVVFDLDSTLADGEHRLHHIKKEPKDWDAFFAECGKDKPIDNTIELLRLLCLTYTQVEIWSGRSAGHRCAIRKITVGWLARYGIGVKNEQSLNFGDCWVERLLMRSYNDHCNDDELKLRWLRCAREAGQAPDLVFEDRRRVVEMYRSQGIACFQVADGDF